jgi:acetyl-CoA decarbonylase/synthase complex subunit gamma
MALTGMQIYKSLPKDHANCSDCGFPTCMAFAMQVASKSKELADCPHISDEAKGSLSDASAPPMKLVKIGAGDAAVEIGQETVMFRHEEKFRHGSVLAAKIAASLSDEDAMQRLEAINAAVFSRVGDEITVGLASVELDGLSADAAASRVKTLAEKSRVPFVLLGEDPAVMGAAVKAIADKKPLIHKGTPENAAAMISVAADNKCPLAIGAPTLEELADLSKAATDGGVAEIVLAFDGKDMANSLRSITIARRAALKKKFRAFGYPAIVDVAHDDSMKETVLASSFAAKYGSVLIINGLDGAELLPLLTTVQNIYTDPQVANTVDAKLYEIGAVGPDSPLLFTTNFSLTYFCVEGEVERSKVPTYIMAVDTEGLGVLNAYAGDKISPEKIVAALKDSGVADKVSHRKLIIPGLLPAFRAEIEETSDWKEVIIGPEAASGIPTFFKENWN